MAHLEIQIAATPLQQTLKQLLLPRLYKQCHVIPVSGLVLDHLEAGTIGPPMQTQTGWTIPIRVGIFLVNQQDVIAANGGPTAPQFAPQLTGLLILTLSGTTFTVAYGGVLHDAAYTLIFNFVAGQVGNAQATTLFAQWEGQVQQALGSAPILSYDFGTNLPPELAGLQFGRSAIAADATRVALRLEIGALGSDGSWTQFLSGTLEDRLQGSEWGLFLTQDAVIQIANMSINAAVRGIGGSVVGNTWAPQGQTAGVESTVSLTLHVHVEVAGITVFDGDVPVVLSLRTTFSIEPFRALNAQHLSEGVQRTDISYNYSIQGNFIADVENQIAHMLLAGNSIVVPGGFTQIGDREFFNDTAIPDEVLGNQLTLSAYSVLGLADGMLIAGKAQLAQSLAPPECNVADSPFVLDYATSCSAIRDHTQLPPTALYVAATAVLFVGEPMNANQFPLVIGQFQLLSDPQQQFAAYLPPAPQQVGSGGEFLVRIPVSNVTSGYLNAPYPCEFLVLTNGGARYVSLGPIPQPLFDSTGNVTNYTKSYINDCTFGEIDPWKVMITVFNPNWLVDPGEGTLEQVARIIGQDLVTMEPGDVQTVSVADDVQIGTVAVGLLTWNQLSSISVGGVAGPAATMVTSLLRRAARLQPPHLRGPGHEKEASTREQ